MKATDRTKHVPGYASDFFSVDSRQLHSDIRYIIENEVENLIMFGRGDYRLTHVDWLDEVSHVVKWLVITPPSEGRFSFDGLKYCKGLSRLKLNNYQDEAIDLSSNILLTELDAFSFRNISGLDCLVNLRVLVLNKPPPRLLCEDVFCKLESLTHLIVCNADLAQGFHFLSRSPLSSLSIFDCRRLSLRGLGRLGLRALEIECCKDIDDFSTIFSLRGLRDLKLIDSVKLDKAADMLRLGELETLCVLGSSWFVDGNLDPLRHRLRVFNFDNKRHYNIRFEAFKASFVKDCLSNGTKSHNKSSLPTGINSTTSTPTALP